MKTNKTLWLALLFLALMLFLLGLNTGNFVYNLLAIIFSFIVYQKGYQDLFKEYDDRQREKKKTAEKIYTALREGKKKGDDK
ncbi:hypothetical protein [Streptococcus ovis]|uniref:hypothetical protein n=1 Tax=Streptococcus ovis TaxID=82806 RepID=UPI000382D3B9|nr:hypothetical protein [Streptococcus ovis]